MGLSDKNITTNINMDQKLWRYMGLDKLIDLLSTKTLFFTPLSSYAKTDPFEGLQPKVHLEPLAKIIKDQKEAAGEIAMEILKQKHLPQEEMQAIAIKTEQQMRKDMESVEYMFFNALKSYVVNCWHQNESESEAMWKLYTDSHKGIAIQTTVKNLTKCIHEPDGKEIYFQEVKYINFDNPEIKSDEVIIDGNIRPILKRKAFEHEREARLYFLPNELEHCSPEQPPIKVSIDTDMLIEKIYISPFAGEPYQSSTRTILNKFDIPDEKIITSDLLTPNSNLLKLF